MAAVKAVTTYRKLYKFGKQYGVAEEEDYKAAIKTYAEQAELIATMRNQLAEDGMTVEKEYVKGRANVCVHPLVQEIPNQRLCASAGAGDPEACGQRKQDAWPDQRHHREAREGETAGERRAERVPALRDDQP